MPDYLSNLLFIYLSYSPFCSNLIYNLLKTVNFILPFFIIESPVLLIPVVYFSHKDLRLLRMLFLLSCQQIDVCIPWLIYADNFFRDAHLVHHVGNLKYSHNKDNYNRINNNFVFSSSLILPSLLSTNLMCFLNVYLFNSLKEFFMYIFMFLAIHLSFLGKISVSGKKVKLSKSQEKVSEKSDKNEDIRNTRILNSVRSQIRDNQMFIYLFNFGDVCEWFIIFSYVVDRALSENCGTKYDFFTNIGARSVFQYVGFNKIDFKSIDFNNFSFYATFDNIFTFMSKFFRFPLLPVPLTYILTFLLFLSIIVENQNYLIMNGVKQPWTLVYLWSTCVIGTSFMLYFMMRLSKRN